MAERKWELTPEQRAWLQSVGYSSEIVELSTEATNQDARESRPAIALQTPSGGSAAATPQQKSAGAAQAEGQPKSDAQTAPSSPDSSQPDAGKIRTPVQTGAGQHADPTPSEADIKITRDLTPATAKALASRLSSSRTVAGRLAEPQLRWRTNRAKNLSRDQFADSPEVTYERRLWRRNNPVQREIRA